ncbi:ABC transporter permease [Candidatus Magnetomonas plexicatena]|uniref:ABC transporter permease n=1 Tax=Candidatus Magnetomonas plexicatena TaxID=2552947 RepID=UPI0010FFEE37|nr:ABC transporter permease subunit [Nitrospirales bacterium LBB_01]
MGTIFNSLIKAFFLIISLDKSFAQIVVLSFKVSGGALILASLIGLPLGALIALREFPFRNTLFGIVNALLGLPPVLVGLLLYLILSRRGPLGSLSILYTPYAMVIAQSILAFPHVCAISATAIRGVNPNIKQLCKTLGATEFQTALTIIREARFGIITAVMAAFGRVISEVGAILIVGGNILGVTRVMTTAIVLETDKGDFELALALGIVLLSVSLLINALVSKIQSRYVHSAPTERRLFSD